MEFSPIDDPTDPHLELVNGPDPFGYAANVATYLAESDVLRPHQVDVFQSLYHFLAAGHTRGYIKLPTGTGKTPVVVEFTKAVQDALDPELRPKVLTPTSTKDLVYQTIRKGFKRFAPDKKVGTFFSDTRDSERLTVTDNDAVVTTYRSMPILDRTPEVVSTEGLAREDLEAHMARLTANIGAVAARRLVATAKRVPTGRTLLEAFRIWMLDEAHRANSPAMAELIRAASKDTLIIGFTATPDASEERQLSKLLPHKIHEMSLAEAIHLELLAPIVPIGVKSGLQIRGRDIYDASGEFIDERIGYLARSEQRNNCIMDTAEVLVANGVGTIISCIAGRGDDAQSAWHARHLAEQLRARGVRAVAVHSGITTKQRIKIYEQFEAGEIDVLTFIGVIGEGWDSQRAKAVINGRPTRSPIFAEQRPGRIARPGDIAFAIEICDEYDDATPNRPITVADILREGSIVLGQAVGEIDDPAKVARIIAQLQAKQLSLLPELQSSYNDFHALLESLSVLDKGRTVLADGGKYAVVGQLAHRYAGVTVEVIERAAALQGKDIVTAMAAQQGSIRTVYHVSRTKELLYELPVVEPEKYHIDSDNKKWMTPEGLVKLFSKRYPDVTPDIMADVLAEHGEYIEWLPAKYAKLAGTQRRYSMRRYQIVRLYPHDAPTIERINSALRDFFAG